jgi:hypothetical protein
VNYQVGRIVSVGVLALLLYLMLINGFFMHGD